MEKNTGNISANDQITKLFKEFIDSEKAGGLLLIFCTVISIYLANSQFQEKYLEFWTIKIGALDLHHWINDGLMAVFFLLIGLELEREIYVGELSSLKKTMLPVSAAIGGMAVPAIIYMLFNSGTSFQSGFGIPMATDIAFAIGILSLLGKKVPLSLKVFLTALAIVDDLGAIMIIAVFYSKVIIWTNLIISLLIFVLLILLNRIRIHKLWIYIAGGIAMWYFMANSGVHSTISGVLLAFAIPFVKDNANSPSYKLQHALHKPVAFFILPLFALANTAIVFNGSLTGILTQTYSLGIMAGLIIGKPLGILLFGYSAVKMNICALPDQVNWQQIAGVGFLAGIGFTMSIFITILAFGEPDIINNAKIAIIISSVISGISGYFFLKLFLQNKPV